VKLINKKIKMEKIREKKQVSHLKTKKLKPDTKRLMQLKNKGSKIKFTFFQKKSKDMVQIETDQMENDNVEMDEWMEPEKAPTKKPVKAPGKIALFAEKYSIVIYIFLAMLINFGIETISRYSFVAAFQFFAGAWGVFLYNSFIIFVTLTISLLFKRRFFASALISGIWMIGGIANGAVLSYRTTPFTGTDMKLINSAVELATKYMSADQMILTVLLIIVAICLFIFAAIRGPKIVGKVKYKWNIIFIAIMFASLVPITKICIETRVLSSYFGNIANAYEDYGFPYCFWCTVLARGIDCPNNYSESEIKSIINGDGTDSYDAASTPNIIIVQLESFFDPELIKNLKFSEDPIPNFRNLEKNYTSGYVTVPVVGAGTANTEFEVITGMSLRYFGPGEYPYKTVMKKNVCESVAYDLSNIGYTTHAIHNNIASFYGRRTVFSRLGFETFTSIEMMNIKDYTALGWAKDATLSGNIMDCLNSTKGQDFIYTITVQSHGGYPTEPVLENPAITVKGAKDEATKNATEYYVNQIHEVDQFIGELVDELSKSNEDTILVLFGDHLPSLGLEAKNLKNGSLYQTEYVIWDNMGLEVKDQNIKAYQLAADALNKAGIHEGTLMKYHQDRMGTNNYESDLEALQYDMLYGKKYVYDGTNPYERVALTMGVKNTSITSVSEDGEGNIIIEGNNFNANSQVVINNKNVDTVYVDENMLQVSGITMNYSDVFAVNQVTSTGFVLRKGANYSMAVGGSLKHSLTE